MDSPEFLWLILLAGYFLFQTVVKYLRQQRGEGDEQQQQGDEDPHKPWWEENWPSSPHGEQEEHQQEEQPEQEQPQTEPKQARGPYEDTYREVFTGRSKRKAQEKEVSEQADTGAEEYHKPSYEPPSDRSGEEAPAGSTYDRQKDKPFERQKEKPYKNQNKKSWQQAEQKLYDWKYPSQKSTRKKQAAIDARQAVIHNTIFNRPYK